MDPYLDFWNLMAYDFAGSWDSTSGHQANIFPSRQNPTSTPFNTHQAVEHYKSQGIAPSKIVLGMPLYGRGFENTDGLGKPYSGIGQGSWEAGAWDYKVLPLAGAQEKYDEEAKASYSYDAQKRELITYDTVSMAKEKAEWVKREGLGGAMWWESSADKQGDGSLIGAVVGCLGYMDSRENCVEYPKSKFENLRKGFC
jgi:chitinase